MKRKTLKDIEFEDGESDLICVSKDIKEEAIKRVKDDLLILDVDVQTIDTNIFFQIEKDNPNIKFFAYIPSQSVNVQDLSSWARLRKINYEKVNNEVLVVKR